MELSSQRAEQLETIVAFLNRIGIETADGDIPDSSFLPGVCIEGGKLRYAAGMPWPGDLLHEAGHIATAPAALRGRLREGVELPDWVKFASEVEATAWAFAALVHLRLPPAVLFHAGGYQGASDRLIETFGAGVYPGAYGLSQAGMAAIGADACAGGVPPYPHMIRWLRA